MNNRISNGLEYVFCKNGTALLSSIGSCTDVDIVVPEFVEGKTVTGVAEGAFARSSEIRSVVLPITVSAIGKNAFAWCHNLEFVSASGVVEIDDKAFIGCDSLSDLGLGSKIKRIGCKSFAHCHSLSSAHLPAGICEIGCSAFEGCRSLSFVSLPDSLRFLENGIFYACTSLRRITLPSSLEYIDEYAFAYCISLESINISAKTVVNRDAFFESSRRMAC
jgi:hypothetical protein